MPKLKLKPRLSTVSNLVEPGGILADVGCDHGLLTAKVLLTDKVQKVIAGDINEQPLQSCKDLIAQYNLTDKVKFVLADGLQDPAFSECTEIAICGMGGELITEILNKFSNLKNLDIYYIFNPMTHPEKLRKFLCDNAFEIGRDIIVKESNHYYNVLTAKYTGILKEYDEAYYYLGNINDFTYKEYFIHLLNYLKTKNAAGTATDTEKHVINAIKERL